AAVAIDPHPERLGGSHGSLPRLIGIWLSQPVPECQPIVSLMSRPSERSERRAGAQRKSSRSDNMMLRRCAALLALGPGSARRRAALVRGTRIQKLARIPA